MDTDGGHGTSAFLDRFAFHDPAPDGFVPLEETPERRALYRFPEEPDRQLLPRLHKAWTAFLTPPAGGFHYLKGAIKTGAVVLANRRAASRGRLRKESSSNWSGGFVKPTRGASLRFVMGSWTVPSVAVPAGADPQRGYFSSTWIGFDGRGQYRHSSLPQIGTKQAAGLLPPGETSFSVWVQWWERDHGSPILELPIPVASGSQVFAMLVVLSEAVVRCHIRVGAAWMCLDVIAPSSSETPPVQYRVSGATAEWILERPSPIGSPGTPYDLPAYSPFDFDHCVAVAVEPTGELHEVGLNPGHFINMYDTLSSPRRRRTISIARGAGRYRLRMEYAGS